MIRKARNMILALVAAFSFAATLAPATVQAKPNAGAPAAGGGVDRCVTRTVRVVLPSGLIVHRKITYCRIVSQ